jgi:hypothetical protein
VWSYRTVGVLAVLAVGTGLLLGLLTSLLASNGPAGDSWSLRGNGALIVPFGLGPALIAAGWTAIVAHFRFQPRWIMLGAVAGLAGLALPAASLLALVVGGSAAAAISTSATLLAALWIIVAPLLTALLPRPGQREPSTLAPHLLGAAVLPAALIAGVVTAQLLLPAGG